MKRRVRHHPLIAIAVLVVLVGIIGAGGYAIYLAGSVDALPWQEVPTPYAGGAFEGISGFGGAVSTATPLPTAIP